MKNRYHKVKPHSYAWLRWLYAVYTALLVILFSIYTVKENIYALLGSVVLIVLGVTFIVTIRKKLVEARRISNQIHSHIVENALCQTEIVGNKERYLFYPQAFWRIDESVNTLYIRFRLTGNKVDLRGLEQGLSDRLKKVCLNIFEERGYIEYMFELKPEERFVINSLEDGENYFGGNDTSIVITPSLVWDYRKVPHFLVAGNTGSGKSTFCKYLIANLLNKGICVYFLDVKGDMDMERYCKENMVKYAREPECIAKAIDEVFGEFQKRAGDMEEIGAKDEFFDEIFSPIFLICDEIILMRLVMAKKLYDDIQKKINSIIVGGRSKGIFCGLITQSAMAEYFGNSGMRENIGLRVALGQMSPTEYAMIFGNEFRDVKNLRYGQIGSGLIMRRELDSRPREFVAPYIKEGGVKCIKVFDVVTIAVFLLSVLNVSVWLEMERFRHGIVKIKDILLHSIYGKKAGRGDEGSLYKGFGIMQH